jgi:tRNA threonylcarbamoyladenosine biosynthesis protein TsaE
MIDVIHFDLYRMGSPEEFLDAGFREYFNENMICIIEWPEKAESVLPSPDINIFLNISGEGRDVELQAMSDQGNQCLDRLKFAPNL